MAKPRMDLCAFLASSSRSKMAMCCASAVMVLLFCQCARVDLGQWNRRRAQLSCVTCGHKTWLDGFTVSEFDPAKLDGRYR